MVEAVANQGKTPPFHYHLRMWGAHLIGRPPCYGYADYGFWGNRLPWPRQPDRWSWRWGVMAPDPFVDGV